MQAFELGPQTLFRMALFLRLVSGGEALTSLRDAIEDLPRYAAPEIDGDGNIIMRRLPQHGAPLEGDKAPDEREGERPDRGRPVERDGGVWL